MLPGKVVGLLPTPGSVEGLLMSPGNVEGLLITPGSVEGLFVMPGNVAGLFTLPRVGRSPIEGRLPPFPVPGSLLPTPGAGLVVIPGVPGSVAGRFPEFGNEGRVVPGVVLPGSVVGLEMFPAPPKDGRFTPMFPPPTELGMDGRLGIEGFAFAFPKVGF
jgi:hypothetical protein